MMSKQYFDSLIIGSGLAGLTSALLLAKSGQQVIIISKKQLTQCNSFYAQGGIAAVLDADDNFTNHINDTMVAGVDLCDIEAVTDIVTKAPHMIKWLISLGINFTQLYDTKYNNNKIIESNDDVRTNDDDSIKKLHLTSEGGHSHRRIVHIDDATGADIVTQLIKQLLLLDNVTILNNHMAVDLLIYDNKCVGAYVLDIMQTKVINIYANNTILATGGAGKVYLYTTNPDTATGDGIALAYRAGCNIQDMEFIQFHPTCLYHPQAKSFLISEAVRGEGGILLLPNGERFMQNHDARLELAPRDVVARAIDFEMKKYGLDCVYLDITHKGKNFIMQHFPNIYHKCLSLGIDITSTKIPVVPAAHYTCGGIKTDINGATDIINLYAIGECASTGLHGANRLASNSLLECLVVANNNANVIIANNNCNQNSQYQINEVNQCNLPSWDESNIQYNDEEIIVAHNWDELRRTMWDYVSIVRTDKRLTHALKRILMLEDEINEFYQNYKLSLDILELRNLLFVAKIIVNSALQRHESRGLHYSRDYQYSNNNIQHTIINKSQIL